MVIMMKLNAPKEDIEQVINKIHSRGCKHHEIWGSEKLAIGVTGQTTALSEEEFLIMNSVDEVYRVSKPYKLVSREVKSEDTVININGKSIGSDELTIIAGPCSIESRDQIFEVAGQLKEMGIKFLRAGAYKPRTSPYAFQGLKEKGLELLADVKKELGMMIVTEAKDTNTLPASCSCCRYNPDRCTKYAELFITRRSRRIIKHSFIKKRFGGNHRRPLNECRIYSFPG